METDGNEGPRPGRVAENWGRQDRIRAGAVSGPWRSAPKTPASPPGHSAEPPDRDAAAPPPEGERIRPTPKPRLVGVWISVAIGLAVAFATVGAAVMLRHSTPPEAAAIVAPPDAPAALAAEPATTAPDPGGVRLRIGPDLADADREAITTALNAAGYGPVQVEVLPFPIAASRIGYYRRDDAGAAEALAAFVQGVVQTPGVELSIRDYSDLLEDAAPGRLDIWIGG